MSEITSLGYVGVHTRAPEDWKSFATGHLGMQLAHQDKSTLAFRMDERRQRLLVHPGDSGSAAYFGWEVAHAAALAALAARLDRHGIAINRASRALADERGVADLVVFQDPAGNRLEAFHGAATAADPFKPGRTISGFVTGGMGMGHAVLMVEHVEPFIAFYRDILGFRLSDYILSPFKAYFFHVNPRHHSFAVIESGRNGQIGRAHV